MVRLRYQYPPAQSAPAPKPQRFPVGTRVANPLEGRTGHIEHFDSATGIYRLIWNDNHTEDVADADVDRFVIRAPAASSATTANEDASPNRDESDPEGLLGSVVLKMVRNYEGEDHPVGGSVASYISGVQRYRVVYANSLIEDLTIEETHRAVARASRKKRQPDGDNDDRTHGDEAQGGDEEDERSRKRQKTGLATDTEPPLNTQRFPSRAAAYTTVRKVLRSILAQEDVKKHRTEKQRTILANEDLKPKKALENFVDADGLKFLQTVLVLWMKKAETHAGAVLVLKILGALPGVTAEAVLACQIGKTLKGITRVSQQQPHVDVALGDLAEWVIRVWRREVASKAMSASALVKQAAQSQGTTLPALYVLPTAAQRKLKEREATTLRLRKLLTEEETPLEPEEPAIFFASYNSLGSIDKRRPMRQIIHIESLVERVHKKQENHREDREDREDEEVDQNGEPVVVVASSTTSERQRVIRFRRRDEVHEFHDKVATYKLLQSERAKVVDATRSRSDSGDAASGGDTEAVDGEDGAEPKKLPPPNKLHAPRKSILKIAREEVFPPYSSIVWA